MKKIFSLFKPEEYGFPVDLGLLILRLGVGLMMTTHGYPKLLKYEEKSAEFYNWLGLGGPTTMILTIFGELFCSIFLALGLGTRLFLIPLIILTIVIAFVVHAHDPFGDKEHALLFLVPYITLMLTGPGKYSLDYFIWNKRSKVELNM